MKNLIHFNPIGKAARYDPFMDIDEVFDRMALANWRPSWFDWQSDEPQMMLEVSDSGKEYIVRAEIPGVKKEDIHVSIDGKLVTISAEIKHEMEASESTRVLRSERRYGKTMRTFSLDSEVIEDKAKATYSDGVLELKLPKKNTVHHKELAIS